MSQTTNTVNFVIHDANGKPQVIKVQQIPTSTTPVKLKPSNSVKFIKLASASESNSQGHSSEILKAIKIKKSQILHGVPLPSLEIQSKSVPIDTAKLLKIKTEQFEVEAETESSLEEILEQIPTIVKSEPNLSQVYSPAKLSHKSSSLLHATMSHATRRRHESDNDPPAEYTSKKRRNADRVGKGLRHFSMKVCEKVRAKGCTSYNEVADELVGEFASGLHGAADCHYDQKNIRRRVYDALNVLMAMSIISKQKKEIRWLGLPTNSVQEFSALQRDKAAHAERIHKKTQQLQELLLQHISFKSLIERNREAERKGLKPSASSAIHLPFIVVNTSDKALIDCSISNDKTEYMFNFNKKFQIHDDIDILKRMGLLHGLDKGECTEDDIVKVKNMVPKSLEAYVEQMGRGVSSKLWMDMIENDEANKEDEHLNDSHGEEDEEGEGQESSDDTTSDVDV